jgi:hypothetical protein
LEYRTAEESLSESLSPQSQLADLVGASRAKVGGVLVDLERRKIAVREGRELVVIARSLEALVRSKAESDA